MGEPRGELFSARSWAAAPLAVDAAPAPAPTAPPNPYKVAGRVIQEDGAHVFLVRGDRIIEAKPGDQLDGGYRVESIAQDQIVLLYLPLGAREILPIESTLGIEVAQAPNPLMTPAAGQAAASSAQPIALGAEKPAQLRWEGPERVTAGAAFQVVLRISTDQLLRASPMQLKFEPDLLESLDVRAGKFFIQGSFSYRVNPDGSIFVGAAGRGAAPGADAELLVLTFRPRKAGATAQVKLASVALQSVAGRELAHDDVSVFRAAIQ